MSEELGKIEKPSAEEFRAGRKLYFVPLIYPWREAQAEFVEKCNKYWDEVENQMGELEVKLGEIHKIYHEFISAGGEDGVKAIEKLNDRGGEIIKKRLEKGAQLEPTEEGGLLTEFSDWSRCLAVGLQNRKVFTRVYEFYIEASKQRNEHIAKQIDETLKANEVGLLLMREGHQVQFPPDIQLFYVAPPALDEIKRWLRDYEAKAQKGE